MNQQKSTRLAKLALFAAALIWGISFIIVKNTVDVFPPNLILAIRFTIAFALLSVIYRRKYRQFNRQYLVSGILLGFLLFLAFCWQTIGITSTTPGKNAFLTAIYCVLVPFIFWFVNHTRPDRYNFLAAALCFIGIGFVSLTQELTIGQGDLLTLLGGLFFALHIVAVAKVTQGRDAILLTILQFGFAALFSWIVTLLFESFPSSSVITGGSVLGVLYLACFSTAVGLLLQNVGQKYTNPASASLILSLESVFGVLFSVLFFGDELTPKLLVGFALIFISIVVSETKLSFLKKGPKK